METKTPVQREKEKRDAKIMRLWRRWNPIHGRTAAYQMIAATGVAGYNTVIAVVKANETQE